MIAVVVPVRDGARYLAEALGSALCQGPDEIVVVDDGSTDDSAALARDLGVTVISQPASGAGAARNLGVQSTTAPLVAFLDADDRWEPASLNLLAEALGDTDLAHGQCAHFASPDLSADELSRLTIPAGVLPALLPGGMLVRRTAFERVGPFRTDLAVGEFIDWYSRATDLGLRAVSVERVVLHRRVHARNTSTLRKASQADLTKAVREALLRRRAAAE